MEKKDLRSLTIEEMTELAESMGQKTFRGKQLFEWIHKKQVENLEEISNLPKAFLEPLQENYMVSGVALVKKQMSKCKSRRYGKIPVFPSRWQSDRECVDEISSWQQRVYFFSGWMPDGMYFLCFHVDRAYKKPDCRRDAFADL